MSKINYGRVLLGGVVAGIVMCFLEWFMNGLLLTQQWEDTMKSLNRQYGYSESFLFWLILVYIVGGILSVWVYAAIRPRFGAGVRTAVYAGMVTWAFASLLPHTMLAAETIYPSRLALYTTLFAVVDIVGGTVVGCALYKEAESTSAYPAAAEAQTTH